MKAHDTLNFVTQALFRLLKGVGLSGAEQKGDFPHHANVLKNWGKIIPFLDR